MNDSDLEYPHTLSYKKLNSLKLKVQSGFLTPSILRKLADEMDYQKKIENWEKKMNYLPLPRELQIKIMEYNANHRYTFKSTLERVPAKSALRITNNVLNNWCKYRYGLNPIRQAAYINIHVPDKECMFYALNSCNCCTRHQMNRPVFGEYPAYNTDNQYTYRCKCRCRQNMRILSRARFLETEGHEPDPRLGASSPSIFRFPGCLVITAAAAAAAFRCMRSTSLLHMMIRSYLSSLEVCMTYITQLGLICPYH